jgi:hypothetical protein
VRPPAAGRRFKLEGILMKLLIGCALMALLSGCIPIGLQGRTSTITAPGAVATVPVAPLAGDVSA